MMRRAKIKNSISRVGVLALITIIIVVIGGVGFYRFAIGSPATTSATSNTSTTNSSSSFSSSTTTSKASLSIAVDESTAPTSVDPGSSFDAPGGEIIQNVYQTLVFFNGSSVSSFVGILARNWTASSDGLTYTFNLWPYETFSDGSTLNASTIWFSIYRMMLMNEGFSRYTAQCLDVQTGITGGGFKGNLTSPGSSVAKETVRLPNGTEQALASAGYSFSNNQTTAWEQATNDLLGILNNFNALNSTIQRVMSYGPQAVEVSGSDQVTLHLMFSFSDFYEVISEPDASAVSPTFVDSHGGVRADSPNGFVMANALGSGPYALVDPSGIANVPSIRLVANPNYWAQNIPSGSANPWLSIPSIGTVEISYQSNETTRIGDIAGGIVQLSQIEVPDLHDLSTNSKISIYNWGPSATFDFASIDAYQFPYNTTLVREAIVHGINATQVQDSVFSSYAVSYNGPLNPEVAYYNGTAPANRFNDSLALSELVSTGFKISLPNGTTYNSSGRTLPTLDLIYVSGNTTYYDEASIIQQQLAKIGLTVAPTSVPFSTILSDMLAPPSSSNYPAFLIGANDPAYVGPTEPVLYLTDCPARCGNGDPAYLNNSALNQLDKEIVQTADPIQLQADYNNITSIVQQSYQYVWLDDYAAYTVASSSITGLYWSVGLDGSYYATAS